MGKATNLMAGAGMAAALAAAAPAAEIVVYGYDPLGRLTRVERTGPVEFDTVYHFDQADNRSLKWTGTGAPPPAPPPAPPAFSIDDFSTGEGDDLVFTVTRHGSINSSYSVGYTTAPGTAAAGTDYTSASGPLTFGPDDFTRTVTVHSTADSAFEPDETLFVNLSGATGGATIVDSQATGTIVNDDSSNQPPVAANDFGTTERCNEGVSINVVANDSDPDSNLPLGVASIQSVSFGSADIESATHIHYTPSGQTGTATVVYRVADSLGATGQATLSINVTGINGPCQ
jgi:Calx-beta domain